MTKKKVDVSESEESETDISDDQSRAKAQSENICVEFDEYPQDANSDAPEKNSTIQSGNEKSSEVPVNTETRKKNLTATNSIFWADELTSDDEVYMFQCPENYKKHLMASKDIEFNMLNTAVSQKTNEVYRLDVLNSEKKFMTLALPRKNSDGCLVNIPLKGHILVQKTVNMPLFDCDRDKNSDSYSVSFPTDIKTRHPLLGVNWKEHIDLANEAIKKNHVMQKKSKKIKREKEENEIDALEDDHLKRQSSLSENFPKKKKKKKH